VKAGASCFLSVEVLAMFSENPSRRRSWPRIIAISLTAFAAWVVLSVLTFRDGPDDPPLIVLNVLDRERIYAGRGVELVQRGHSSGSARSESPG